VTTALATLALQVGDDLARTLRAAGPNFVVLPAGARLPLDLGGVEFLPPRAGLRLDESAVGGLKTGFWRNNVLEAAPELSLDVTRRAPRPRGRMVRHGQGGASWTTGFAGCIRLEPRGLAADGADEVVLDAISRPGSPLDRPARAARRAWAARVVARHRRARRHRP
jgi:hypothetical protein